MPVRVPDGVQAVCLVAMLKNRVELIVPFYGLRTFMKCRTTIQKQAAEWFSENPEGACDLQLAFFLGGNQAMTDR